jgi:PAS domain-containing protein
LEETFQRTGIRILACCLMMSASANGILAQPSWAWQCASTRCAMIDQDKSKQELIDITQRKRAEEALHDSEDRFRKVFEEGPLGILLVGTDGRIQHANQHVCDMLGYSENETIGPGTIHPFPAFGAAKSRTTKSRNVIFARMARRCGLN